MPQDGHPNQESRDETIRERMRSFIRGHVRLRQRDRDVMINDCREIYFMDDVPEEEQGPFFQFAADEIERAEAQLKAEQATWPTETDCDRLDRVEEKLRDDGILLWQVSPCCDSCTGAELPDRIQEIERRYPGFGDRVRGYAFFIDQNMPEELANDTQLTVYLAYGWCPPEGTDPNSELYEAKALAVAQEVVECLQQEGFTVDWDGDFSYKIGLSLNWQRRKLLV